MDESVSRVLLLVEENKARLNRLRELIAPLAKPSNIQILAVDNAVEAGKILQTHPIHFIVTGVMMVRVDGFELMMRARQRRFDFPVFLVSDDPKVFESDPRAKSATGCFRASDEARLVAAIAKSFGLGGNFGTLPAYFLGAFSLFS